MPLLRNPGQIAVLQRLQFALFTDRSSRDTRRISPQPDARSAERQVSLLTSAATGVGFAHCRSAGGCAGAGLGLLLKRWCAINVLSAIRLQRGSTAGCRQCHENESCCALPCPSCRRRTRPTSTRGRFWHRPTNTSCDAAVASAAGAWRRPVFRAIRIERRAFSGCGNLTSLSLPSGLANIGEEAFQNSSLASVIIPSRVAEIGPGAFAGCSSLSSVTLPESLVSIGERAFTGCGLTSVVVPSGAIGHSAFESCRSLTNAILKRGVSLGPLAFSFCINLTQIELPEDLKNIPNGTFAECIRLARITIPSSVTAIGSYAFSSHDSSLSAIYFEGNAPTVGDRAFSGGTAYYLPGTLGWGPRLGTLPTALWMRPNPVILDGGPGFGVQTTGFSFTMSWATNRSVAVEACSDLTNGTWAPVGTNALTSGTAIFSDPHWTDYPQRFYRLRGQ
jgi:hypothetical protein